MDNSSLVQQKAIAKERGIRGYYKFRKAKLIHVLELATLVEQTSNIIDESIPSDPTSVLQPTPLRPSNITTNAKQNTKKILTKGMQKNKDFGEWLLNYLSPKPKVVDIVLESFKNKIQIMYEKRDTLFQPTQSKSALRNFAIQYRIKGSNGYEPESFLLNSKQPITNLKITHDKLKLN